MATLRIDRTTLDYWNLASKKAHFRQVVFIVLASIMGVSSFALFIIGPLINDEYPWSWTLLIAGGVLFFVATPAFVFLTLHEGSAFRKAFCEKFAKPIGAKYYDEFAFAYRQDKSALGQTNFALKHCDDEETAFFSGKQKGVAFFSYAYSYTYPGVGHPEAAYGRYIHFTMTKEYPSFCIRSRTLCPIEKNGAVTYPCESTLFERTYVTSGADALSIAERLTPKAIDSLLRLNNEGKMVISLSLEGNSLDVYCHARKEDFELSLAHPISEESLERLAYDISLPSLLGEALGL